MIGRVGICAHSMEVANGEGEHGRRGKGEMEEGAGEKKDRKRTEKMKRRRVEKKERKSKDEEKKCLVLEVIGSHTACSDGGGLSASTCGEAKYHQIYSQYPFLKIVNANSALLRSLKL